MRHDVRPTAGLQPFAVRSFWQVSVQVATHTGAGSAPTRPCPTAAPEGKANTQTRSLAARTGPPPPCPRQRCPFAEEGQGGGWDEARKKGPPGGGQEKNLSQAEHHRSYLRSHV